ncbi:hypothetical protein H6F43_19035 [Leptolyngbya sp. FACHB-36]|nr:hypothetical protein [Leptolyngbya sp. FACHB-36]
MVQRWTRSALVCLSLLTTIALPATAATETKTATLGDVKAVLSYQKVETEGWAQYPDKRMTIQRSGQTILDAALPNDSEYDRPLVDTEYGYFRVVDLEGDREPEVLLDLFTGGAHCCTYSLIYRYDSKTQRYTSERFDWAHSGYRLEDLDRDGIPEFRSLNNRFAYAFASFAGSAMPLQIWQYRQGQRVDVTRRYPKLLYQQAYTFWNSYTEAKQKTYEEVKGLLAPYLADKCLLGQGQDGWQRVRQTYQERDRDSFFTNLRQFLKEGGYQCGKE